MLPGRNAFGTETTVPTFKRIVHGQDSFYDLPGYTESTPSNEHFASYATTRQLIPAQDQTRLDPKHPRKRMIYWWRVLQTERNRTFSVNSTPGIGLQPPKRGLASTSDFPTAMLFAPTMITMDSVP